VRIKICGLTRPSDAALAASLGAELIGLDFRPDSPRFVSVEEAREIGAAVPPAVQKVGLFVNASPDDILTVVLHVRLQLVQLHGEISPETTRALGTPWVRALRVRTADDLDALAAEPGAAAFLLELPWTEVGGAASSVGSTLAASAVASSSRPIFLAGHLTPENVGAIARAIRPQGVDVTEGVESSPGIKDPDLLRRFLENARRAGS
jgi:phosphoribosylanthranilate isomerase